MHNAILYGGYLSVCYVVRVHKARFCSLLPRRGTGGGTGGGRRSSTWCTLETAGICPQSAPLPLRITIRKPKDQTPMMVAQHPRHPTHPQKASMFQIQAATPAGDDIWN